MGFVGLLQDLKVVLVFFGTFRCSQAVIGSRQYGD